MARRTSSRNSPFRRLTGDTGFSRGLVGSSTNPQSPIVVSSPAKDTPVAPPLVNPIIAVARIFSLGLV